ncbi:hypothetical protein JOF48_002706 [Arthrobacter stackebrandtii]|uniref:DUF8094 domain-containing protein n=1 Tax=Arthrobacter stackebrandtii TaxID=272161 RepID=A0ABS4YZM1_9MICC|nr:hypothetical protein [Arthrobacter stackebrandtii]MBP2413907.1 hypothetical protein [Arthrobacter stackebrandtii]
MRSKIAIVLAVLGLVVLGLGIGQRTIWQPPASLTASAPAALSPTPLTVISPELLKTRDGKFTLTIKGEGVIQLAVARERDINGWVGDAAHTTIGAANEEFTALAAQSDKGAAEVPNPAGSDMWVSEEKATGELNYTWQAPGHGDWALLLSSDGKAPAPTNISITVENEVGTPWAVPLMVAGSALLALAALLFFMVPRKPKPTAAPAAAVPGRRAAGRVPNDPETGALEVARILAARDKANAAAAPATIAEQQRRTGATPAPVSDGGAGAAPAAPAGDAASALPRTLQGPADDAAPVEEQPAKDNDDDHDGPAGPGTGGGTRYRRPGGSDGSSRRENRKRWDDGRSMSVKARWGAALAAVLLAGSISPAMAEETTPAPDPAASTAPASDAATPAADPSATPSASPAPEAAAAGFPNLLASQVERIAAAVATTVGSGDNSRNAKDLEPRVAGMALQMRTANYQVRASVESEPAPEPVNATKLLSQVVSTKADWPRSAMLVTKGANNELPQLLTLVQANPRESYKLVQATPLLPGQTFPKVDKEGTSEVKIDSGDGLLMPPDSAIAALSDRLTKPDSQYIDTFKDNLYITSVQDLQKQIADNAKDADYVFSHTGDLDSVVSLRTADGGAMVVVGYTFGIDATSKADATLTVGDDAAVFTGGKETTKGFNLSYAEPVVIYIPPAGGDTQLNVISANRALVGGSFK